MTRFQVLENRIKELENSNKQLQIQKQSLFDRYLNVLKEECTTKKGEINGLAFFMAWKKKQLNFYKQGGLCQSMIDEVTETHHLLLPHECTWANFSCYI